MSSDFVIASDIHLQGLRTVYEPDAICAEVTNQRSRDEFSMRVRIIEQTMSAMSRYREVLSLRKHGMFAFQMISHKVLRYAVPVCVAYSFRLQLVLNRRISAYIAQRFCVADGLLSCGARRRRTRAISRKVGASRASLLFRSSPMSQSLPPL